MMVGVGVVIGSWNDAGKRGVVERDLKHEEDNAVREGHPELELSVYVGA